MPHCVAWRYFFERGNQMKQQIAEKKKKEKGEATCRIYLYMCFASFFAHIGFYNYSNHTGIFTIVNECNFSGIK